MPIWLRVFTFEEMQNHYKEINKQGKKKTLDDEVPKGPAIRQPDYISKARK